MLGLKQTGNLRYRHEFKYLCNDTDIICLRDRLPRIMNTDPHALNEGGYVIRSIYFDDYNDSCLRDNEEGVSNRDKWRIRAYDLRESYISLERKSKRGDMINKSSCVISRMEMDSILEGKELPMSDRTLLNRFQIIRQTALLKPKIVVEYIRYPFICDAGNVRVTLDCNISSSEDIGGFFDPHVSRRPILPVGEQILEVKYDGLIPDYIYNTIQMRDMKRISFSKYYLCRQFSV